MAESDQQPEPLTRGLARQEPASDSLPDYETLRQMIANSPKEWLPGLLGQAVFSCESEKVFDPGSFLMFVAKCQRLARATTNDSDAQ
jgi:hypothetical protein